MSTAAGGAAAAAAASAVIHATRASGVLVRLTPREWSKLLGRAKNPVVVHARGGFMRASQVYLFSYKGLAFSTQSTEPLDLPSETEVVEADRIWIPR